MLRLARPWPVLAASLLLGGCYVGLDLEDRGGASGASTGTSTGAEDASSTGAPTTGGSTSAGTSGDGSGEASSGAIDESTGEVGSTGDDPGTSGPISGDASSSSGGDESTGESDSGLPPPVDVPDNAYCVPVGNWDPAWAQLELDVLEIVNQVRAQGADCKSKGMFAPAGPLTMDPALRCAARKHSADMAARNFFSHTNPDNESPWDRMGKAGYGGYSNAGENIAAGSPDAQGTMNQWMGSDGHCANIMNPGFQHLGVGYSPGGQYGHLWTQVFGAK